MDAPANVVTLPPSPGRPPIPGSPAAGARPTTGPPPIGAPATGSGAARVEVERDRIVVERLVLVDASLAALVAERPAGERAGLVERALKIGLTALMDAGVTVNVDAVRAEFAALLRQTEDANAKAAQALDQLLRQNFADGDGRLPRTLEAFLGDRGRLRTLTDELFDESKRDSAIGRIKTLLGSYLEGDGSRLATLLDPTRLGSPLFQFRSEITEGFSKLNERIAALEAASTARAQERAKGTAKGGDFEDLLERLLAEGARGAGDMLDRTTADTGAVLKSRKGDFVLTIDPAATRGHELRVVIEAKDRPMSLRAIRDELREAKENRGAAVGVIVFTPAHAPSGIDPFTVLGGDVYCVVDPEAPEPALFSAAIRLARLMALGTLDDREVEVDAAAIGRALAGVRAELEAIRTLKSQLTSIGNATKAVWGGLDALRSGILAKVADAEAELGAAP
jgi:hypothetical protein